MTRAVPVIVERSPGDGGNWSITVGRRTSFFRGRKDEAIDDALNMLCWEAHQGGSEASMEEQVRVGRLLRSELARQRRAEITAEVSQ